jgi:flagellar motility protein MotE (MotC chaperone)
MKKLFSPIAVMACSLVLSTGVGLGWFWHAGQIIVASHVAAIEAETTAALPPEPWDFWTVEIENLSREMNVERTRLATWESELNARESRIEQERSEIEMARQQVEALQRQINEQIVAVQTQELRNLKNLAATYSMLSPAAAVAIFEQMDDTTVTKLLSLMKTEAASKILEEFTAGGNASESQLKRAAELSQRLRLLVPATVS